MRTYLKCFMLSVFAAALLWAEEAPVKKRPRIRVYDQSAHMVSVAPKVEDTRAAEADLQKRIRQDIKAPGSLENPVSNVSFLPELGTSSLFSQPEAGEDTEAESWINPEDFLLDEDMMSQDDLLKAEAENKDADSGEMEITDWEALQKNMIEDALFKKEVEMTDEEMEEFLANESENADRLNQSGGLNMDTVAPVEDLNASSPGNRGGTDIQSLDMGGFVPVLPTRDQLNGEISRPQRERDPRFELSGSRNLLNNLKENWNTPADRGIESRPARIASPALPGESLMSRGSVSASGFSGLSRDNPAVMPLPSAQPLLRDVAPVNREPAAPPPRNDFRIRSTLGLPPGM
jgi:hypothetical protein